MTRHDWIVIVGIVATALLVMGGGVYHAGQIDDHVGQVERRLQVVEGTTREIDRKLSGIEGHLGIGPYAGR